MLDVRLCKVPVRHVYLTKQCQNHHPLSGPKLHLASYFVQSMNVPVRLGYQINGLVIQYNLPSDTFIVLGCVFYQTDLPQLYWQFFQKKQEQRRV